MAAQLNARGRADENSPIVADRCGVNLGSRSVFRALTLTAIMILLAVASAAQASESQMRFECHEVFDDKIVLTLEKGSENFEDVSITLHGIQYSAVYVRKGLEFRWVIDGDENYQVIVDPDMKAGYYDFENQEDDVYPMSVFVCELVGGGS